MISSIQIRTILKNSSILIEVRCVSEYTSQQKTKIDKLILRGLSKKVHGHMLFHCHFQESIELF